MKDSDSGRCHVLTSGSWQRAVGRRRLIVQIVNIVYQKKLEIEIPEKHTYERWPTFHSYRCQH